MYDVIIVGAGVIGSLMARELSRYQLKILLIDKEKDVSMGASKANSAIVHGGYAESHELLKGRLCYQGRKSFDKLNQELDFGFEKIGSLVLAWDEEGLNTLQDLYENGKKNGLDDLQIISGEDAKKIEPSIEGSPCYALYCKGAGVCSPYELVIAAAENAISNGVELQLCSEVTAVGWQEDHYKVRCIRLGKEEWVDGRYVINAAGMHSDDISNMVGNAGFSIIPRTGEYLLFQRKNRPLVSSVIFNLPTEMGKGVLITKTYHNNVLVGPDALDETKKTASTDTHASRLVKIFLEAKKIVPQLDKNEYIRSFSGIRATSDNHDFVIEMSFPQFLNLAGIQSPGLTSSPAIVDFGINLLQKAGLKLLPNKDFDPIRKPIIQKKELLSPKEWEKKNNRLWKELICRCEQVEADTIINSAQRNIPITTIDGIKRRTRCSMGSCQGASGCRVRAKEALTKNGNFVDVVQDYEAKNEQRVSKSEFIHALLELTKKDTDNKIEIQQR